MPRRDDEQATAALIAEGRAAVVAGEKARAQVLLQAAVRKEPDNVEAWLWLSGAHSVPEDIAYCLRKVLLLDPGNDQAREGLNWLAQTHGLAIPPALATEPTTDTVLLPQPYSPLDRDAPPSRSVDERQTERRQAALQVTEAAERNHRDARARAYETGFYVLGVGMVAGLLRLVAAMRPSTLLVVRPSAGQIEALDAVLLALAVALLHGIVLVLGWLVFAWGLGQARNDRRDTADTLYRAGDVLMPGYLLLAAVALAAVALPWSEQRWLPVVGLIWATMIGSVFLIARRTSRLFDLVRIPQNRRTLHAIRLLGPAVALVVAGFVVAGIAMRVLINTL